jgi:hypothetical protein
MRFYICIIISSVIITYSFMNKNKDIQQFVVPEYLDLLIKNVIGQQK